MNVPLIKPEIQRVLRASGLEKEETTGTPSEQLSSAGLGTDDIADELVQLAKNSGNESLRLRALETALKVHGALKEQSVTQIPSFTIVIQSSSPENKVPEVNPILFPRQSLSKTSKPS